MIASFNTIFQMSAEFDVRRPGSEAEMVLLEVRLSSQAICHKHIKA